MPQPNLSNVHVNVPLTNMSVAYVQDQSHFIADRVFPNIPVTKQSDRYYVYSRADFNRDEMRERAPGTESAGGGYTLDNTPTYYAPVNAYHKDIDDQIRANSDSVLGPDRDATIFVTQKALIRRERAWAANYFAAGIWGSQEQGVAAAPVPGTSFLQWNDAGSTPIEDVRTAKRKVLEATGFEPNKLTLGKAAYDALVDHPDIVDRVKYGQTPGKPAMVNVNALAQLFELEEILVSKAVFNAGAKGADYAASAAKELSQFIAGKHALLAYVTPTPSIMQPTAGYTFSWSGWFGATGMGMRIKKFRMEWLESDRVEVQQAFDQKVVGADLGFFFKDAVA
jgi:hypothetical protein